MRSIQNRFFIFFAFISITLVYLTYDALKASSKIKMEQKEQRSVMKAADITLKRANSKGILYEGSIKSAIKDGNKEVLLGVNIVKKGESRELLKAEIVTNFKDKTLFDKGFTYANDKGVKLSANTAIYDKDKKKVIGDGGFILTSKDLISKGKSFIYFIKSKELKASGISAKFDGSKL